MCFRVLGSPLLLLLLPPARHQTPDESFAVFLPTQDSFVQDVFVHSHFSSLATLFSFLPLLLVFPVSWRKARSIWVWPPFAQGTRRMSHKHEEAMQEPHGHRVAESDVAGGREVGLSEERQGSLM